ncbi:hypothetical protein [Kitasatospora sp. NPDC004289]
MSQFLRRSAVLTCGAGLVLGLVACQPKGDIQTGGASPAATASTSSSPSPRKSTGTEGLPNGAQLAAMLLPAEALPTLKLNPDSVRSTGTGFNPPISPSAVPQDQVCKAFDGSAWSNVAGYSYASFAQNDYTDESQDMFAQELETYRGDDARVVMGKLREALTACHGYVSEQDGVKHKVTIELKELPGVGDEAVQAVRTAPTWTGGATLVAARVGSVVVTTYYNDQRNTGSAGIDLTKALVKNVTAAR